jgi:ribosomal protein S18 acetylase RimI-like enzyme
MIALNLQPGSDKAEIEEFFVDPNFHGRGIGRTLLSKLLEACFSCGVKAVGLDADPNAEGVYSRYGFTTIGRSPSRSIPGRSSPEWNYASTEHQSTRADNGGNEMRGGGGFAALAMGTTRTKQRRPGAPAAKLLQPRCGRRIAANIAKLPELLRKPRDH